MAFFILKIKKEASNETDRSRNEDGVSDGKYQSERYCHSFAQISSDILAEV